MFRFGFLFRFLLALLIIGGLVAGGVAIYRLGWAQGYQTSVLLSSKAGAPAQPALPAVPYYGYPMMPYYYGPHFGFPFFPLIGIGFFLFFLFIIGGLFRFGMHRRWAQAGHWSGGRGAGMIKSPAKARLKKAKKLQRSPDSISLPRRPGEGWGEGAVVCATKFEFRRHFNG